MAFFGLQWIPFLGVVSFSVLHGAWGARVTFEEQREGAGTATATATATALRFASKSRGAAVANFPGLCAPEIAKETCQLLNEENPEALSKDELKEALSSSEGAIEALWSELGLTGDEEKEEVACEALCQKLLGFFKSHKWVMPSGSDLGCYVDEGGADRCDLDLSAEELSHAGHFADDLPDFHKSERLGETVAAGNESNYYSHNNNNNSNVTQEEEEVMMSINYTVEQLAMHAANIFRIFPKMPVELTAGLDEDLAAAGSGTAALLQGNSSNAYNWNWRSDIMKVNQLAEAVVTEAIRKFNSYQTRPHMQKWFGDLSYSEASSRKRVRQVLNSIDHMLGDVDYVFPGLRCRPGVYAYVYPGYKYPFMARRPYVCKPEEIRFKQCTKTTEEKFVFYLCDLTMKSGVKEQIETLTHEGSHHATAYTTDICLEDDWTGMCTSGRRAYGRPTCERLAKYSPEKAVNNADSYCYYLSDVHSSSSSSSSSSSDSS